MDKEALREKINNLIGHDGVDGTYIYCLTRVKEAFHVGTMTLDDFVEVDEDFTEQFVDLFEKEIESLHAERSALLEGLRFYADPATYDIDHLDKHGYIIIDQDGGEIARQALTTYSEKEINTIRLDVATIREHGDKVQKVINEIESLEAKRETNEHT